MKFEDHQSNKIMRRRKNAITKKQWFSSRLLSRTFRDCFKKFVDVFYQSTMLRVVSITVLLLVIIAIINDADASFSNLFSFSTLIGVPFESAESITAITVVILYLKDTPNRKMRQRNELAKLIENAAPQIYNSLTHILKQHSAEGISLGFFDFSKFSNLEKADLSKAKMPGANFVGVNLESANFQWANLWKANFKNANLAKADLTQADLSESNLNNAVLKKAKLIKADLYEANLYQANLYQADLTGADLRGADLTDANLGSAILTGVDLIGARLAGVDLSKVAFRKTIMPNGEIWNRSVRRFW